MSLRHTTLLRAPRYRREPWGWQFVSGLCDMALGSSITLIFLGHDNLGLALLAGSAFVELLRVLARERRLR